MHSVHKSLLNVKVFHIYGLELPAFKAVCGGIEELTDYTLLSKGNKEGKVLEQNLLLLSVHNYYFQFR